MCMNSPKLRDYFSPNNSNRRLVESKVSLERISIKLDGCLLKDRRTNSNLPGSEANSPAKNVVLGAKIKDLLPDENSKRMCNSNKLVVNLDVKHFRNKSNAMIHDPKLLLQENHKPMVKDGPATRHTRNPSFLKSDKIAQYKATSRNSTIVSKEIVLCSPSP
mgnify:FL=1